MHPLEERIRKAEKEKRTAVIPFLTAGFPDRKSFWKHLEDLDDAGSDIIEIGVPFSDPVADGPVVENASRKALAQGITLKEIIEGLKERKGKFKAGIVLMGYINPFYQYGFEKLAQDCAEAGVEGLIIPDLPFEEEAGIRKFLDADNIALIPLVGLNTNKERMKLYAEDAKGYAYVVSVMGITGARNKIAEGAAKTLELAREVFNVPIALGFGLKRPEQLLELPEAARPDAAVFGSALLTHLESGGKAAEFLAPWVEKNAANRTL